MCGIFGVIAKEEKYNKKELVKLLEDVASLSQVRGKDSAGLAFRFESNFQINVLKGPVSINELLKTNEYKEQKRLILNEVKEEKSNIFASLGHARLVTNGSQLEDVNNQPVVKDKILVIHNGIIVNHNKLWTENPKLFRRYEIDTEIIPSMIRAAISSGNSIYHSVSKSINNCRGTISVAMLFEDRNELILASNNGSLYLLNKRNLLVFASERYILKKLINNSSIFSKLDVANINQVIPNTGIGIDLSSLNLTRFSMAESTNPDTNRTGTMNYKINVITINSKSKQKSLLVDSSKFYYNPNIRNEEKLLEYNIEKILHLVRCKKCLLPETFPNIKYDSEGICNICRNYTPKNQPTQKSSLSVMVEMYRKHDGSPDCLVPFSGGRDSSYMLHYLKSELGMNPITFTYDWGMVTDLARRNIARLCGELGVENIVVSANIRKKRENISKNVAAWLKKPSLGMVPLFMIGDKLFFYYSNKLLKDTNTKLSFSGSNSLENTEFKTGFSGLDLDFSKKHIDSLSKQNKLKLYWYIIKNVFKNPSYINSSIYDSVLSFIARYSLSRKDLIFFYGYVKWNEKEIENTLINQYDWELAKDTESTWRIGDGTVGFYNYIYYTIAGFSEIDTFRSNQIREGLISREDAFKCINKENKPRYESIKWYLETIGIDYNKAIKTINGMPKLYDK